ncbi:hypothetical protein C4D60_Mb01t09210 [Musa balbisiana]|uniref:Uncharacterized protein n=1 Tax=Musa balbisiana TaxID=52838 RepID=A0A4S8JLS8_MUSBA|nr:hypothetical protein C4D60_Mb01t09210 [Musa balbisiana]
MYQPCHCPRLQGIDDVEVCIIDLILFCHLTNGNIYIESDPLCCSQDHVLSTLQVFYL